MMRSTIKQRISEERTFLMGIAMVVIVLFHINLTLYSPRIYYYITQFGFWGVDIFLFLSGFGCSYALEKYTRSGFYRGRLVRLMPACIIAGSFMVVSDLIIRPEQMGGGSSFDLIIRLLSLHLWYIQAILIIYFLSPFIYFILKKYKVYGLFGMIVPVVILSFMFPNYGLFKLQWILWRFPVFLIGMYIGLFDLKITKVQKYLSALALLIAVVSRFIPQISNSLWPYLIAAAMPVICDTLCRLKGVAIRLHIYNILEIIGLYTLEIYLIHEYIMQLIASQPLPIYYKIPVSFIIIIILVYFLKKIVGAVTRCAGLK